MYFGDRRIIRNRFFNLQTPKKSFQKATQLNFARLANALFNLNKANEAKTQRIFKPLQSIFTIEKLTQQIQTTKYETVLYNFAIFPKLEADFGQSLLQSIKPSYLFQWDKIVIVQFNQLFNAFYLAKFSATDEHIKTSENLTGFPNLSGLVCEII